MVLLNLILAHLLGDFVFQSNDLIQRKYKSWTGTFQHVCIITAFTIVMLLPYWAHRQAWFIIGTIFVVHFVQDCLKIQWDIHYNPNRNTIPFFVDQILHITLIYFLSSMLDGLTPLALPTPVLTAFGSPPLLIYLMGVILFSYTYDITLYQFLRQKDKNIQDYKPNFEGMTFRVGAFTLFYIPLIFLFMGGSFM